MDSKLALQISGTMGALYTVQLLAVPSMYLESDGQPVTEDNINFCRGIAGGIAGLVSISYMGANSENKELRTAALCASATAFAIWSANNISRVVKGKDSVQAKMDVACSLGLGALVTAALFTK